MSGKRGQHRNAYAKPYFFYQKHDSFFGGGNESKEKEKAVKLAKYKRNKNA